MILYCLNVNQLAQKISFVVLDPSIKNSRAFNVYICVVYDDQIANIFRKKKFDFQSIELKFIEKMTEMVKANNNINIYTFEVKYGQRKTVDIPLKTDKQPVAMFALINCLQTMYTIPISDKVVEINFKDIDNVEISNMLLSQVIKD